MGHMTSRLQPGYVNLSLWQSHTRTPPNELKISEGFRRSIGLWRALPAALGAIFWSTQMIYFLFWFVSRPPLSDGAWPRIGPSYAAFPFISCVGAVRELSFKAVSITVAVLLWTAFGIDFFVGRRSPVGEFWRLGKLICSSVSSVFLIALSFESVNDHHKLHLIFTSFQIIGMGLAKACDWNLNRAMKERTPSNQYLKKSRAWKRVAVLVALPSSIIAIIGIYGCTARFENRQVIFTSECWTLVSFAAVAEWTLSWCWVVFLGTVAYDNYHLEHTVYLLLNSPAKPKKPKDTKLKFWRGWLTKEADFLDTQDDREVLREPTNEPDKEHDEPKSSPSLVENGPEGGHDDDEADSVRDEEFELGGLPPTVSHSVLRSGGYHQVYSSTRPNYSSE